jgi:hypothetical protein
VFLLDEQWQFFFRIAWYWYLFNDAVSTQDYIALDIRMNRPGKWIGKDREESNHVLIFGTIPAFTGSYWGKPPEISVIMLVPAQIRKRSFPNTVAVAIFVTTIIKGLPDLIIFRILGSYSLPNRCPCVYSNLTDRPNHVICHFKSCLLSLPHFPFPSNHNWVSCCIYYLKKEDNARTLGISAGGCRLMEGRSVMGFSSNFQLTELSRLSTVGYRNFYSMPESALPKVTCSVTSLIFLVVVLSCSRLMSGCQGQAKMRSLQKSYKK